MIFFVVELGKGFTDILCMTQKEIVLKDLTRGVIVVNYCFTSLLDTNHANGHLIDIVKRLKQCIDDMNDV